MRRLLAATICACLISVSQAQSIAQIITPSPVSLALTIGQWLMMDRKKLYYIEVESRAQSFQQAKEEGFRLAVEHAVGSLLLAETEVKNSHLTRDDIITYASGYVDKFEIASREDLSGGTILRMKIWVAHSAIANRLLNQSATAGELDGERTAAQVATITQERQTGDRVLGTVLADYPQRAFDVTLKNTRVVYNQNRQPELQIEFIVQWNRLYLDSIGEAVQAVNQESGCASTFGRCEVTTVVKVVKPGLSRTITAGFNDGNSWHLFQQQTIISQPSVLVQIKDVNRDVKYRRCFSASELDHQQWVRHHFVDVGPGQVTVFGDLVKWYNYKIGLENMPLEQLRDVELSIVRRSECF